jgi:hypothetical protein
MLPQGNRCILVARGYAAGVDLWITPQGQGYPQAPHPLGQRKSGVAHRSTASAAAKDFFIFKKLKKTNYI